MTDENPDFGGVGGSHFLPRRADKIFNFLIFIISVTWRTQKWIFSKGEDEIFDFIYYYYSLSQTKFKNAFRFRVSLQTHFPHKKM